MRREEKDEIRVAIKWKPTDKTLRGYLKMVG